MRASELVTYSLLLVHSLLLVSSLFAAPTKGGAESVAEGYPAWTGITPKNHIWGRRLVSESELRQRVTVVVEFDAAKTTDQVEETGGLAFLNGYFSLLSASSNWETAQIPHDVMVIYVARNVTTHDQVIEGLSPKDKKDAKKYVNLGRMSGAMPPIYEDVTFEGAPPNGGKLPFVYVMGYEGKEPLLKQPFGPKTRSAINSVVAAQRKKLLEEELTWRPFYGYVKEVKHFKDLDKLMSKGKPLEPLEGKLKKGIASKDAETAKEAQMLYDALEQTRGDYMFIAQKAAASAPHVAAYYMNLVLKCWPKVKKQLLEVSAKLKENGSAKALIQAYPKIREWSSPDFECKSAAEAKKILAELNKIQRALTPLKDDKSITIQNGALLLNGIVDELIMAMQSKVSAK